MPANNQEEQAKSLLDLIDRLRCMFDSDEVDIDKVKTLMVSYRSNPAEWIKYAHCDEQRYTRNLVDIGNGKYNLMIVCWPHSTSSSIHNHSDAHCVMKTLAGSLYEVRYQWPRLGKDVEENIAGMCGMKKILETRLDNANSVAYINDSIGLHRVENRDEHRFAVSLHLYCPPFNQCQTFDETTGLPKRVPMTFDTEHIYTPAQQYRVSRRKISTGMKDKDFLVFEDQRTTTIEESDKLR